jgi:hypothetical protein
LYVEATKWLAGYGWIRQDPEDRSGLALA